MKVRILQAAGDYAPGVHDIPTRNARALIHAGYAVAIGSEADTPGLPAETERAAEAHGTGRGRGKSKREVRG